MPDSGAESPATATPGPALQVVGLGPGDWSLLTIGALERLLAAERIILRTAVHPTVAPLRARLRPGQRIESFDARYEQADSFDQLYDEIVAELLLLAAAADTPLVYAVPGHPLVGERTVTLLLQRAQAQGVAVEVVDGISFLEPVLGVLGLDPLASNLQIVDGAALLQAAELEYGDRWLGAASRLLPAGRPLIIGQVYDRRVASACKIWLLERYPPDHRVQLLTGAGTAKPQQRAVRLAELDHQGAFTHLCTLYVPPLDPLQDLRGVTTLPFIAARLRAPDGCPWDRAQTLQSLKPHLLEEAHEAAAALDAEDFEAAAEELGDVLLLLTMLAQIGEESGDLDLAQIHEAVNSKLIRRHPHVFGDLELGSADAVVRNWERLKASERVAGGSALDGVPEGMPALIAAQVIGRKAATLGFDWPNIEGVWAKVREELVELADADGRAARLEELGDLLFTLVSLCRHLDLDAEEALRRANAKFRARFGVVERLSAERGLDLAAQPLPLLDALWDEAKAATSR